MNIDRINQMVMLTANVGVLIGIFALVIELQQTQTAMQAEAGATRTQMSMEQQSMTFRNGLLDIRSRFDNGEKLTQQDLLNVREYNQYMLRFWEHSHFQHELGVLDEEIWQSNLNGLQLMCAADLFRQNYYPVWKEIDSRLFRASYVKLVTSICEGGQSGAGSR